MRAIFRLVLVLLLLAFGNAAQAQKRIALTFDDIPRTRGAFMEPEERTKRLIAALRAAKVKQAAFFLNPGFLATPDGAGGEARIGAYVAAGHVIANHSFSHPMLANTKAEDYLANIDKAEAWLKDRPGRRPWFRYPYLNEGERDKVKRDAVREGLKARGLANGYVTADGSDWFLEQLTVDAAKAGKKMDMAQLRRLYIQMHVSGAEFYDALARRALGRSPAHVMLMHETDLAAMWLPDLVTELRRHGWKIITADEAFRDPIRKELPDVDVSQGPLTEMIANEKKVEWPIWPIWMHPGIAEPLFKTRVLKETPAK